ncbi:hypothetical protein GW17_00041149 [Ensete ventricosum]|nr:hypothetical protein GW17_00041149 [Ensete ventricosum]
MASRRILASLLRASARRSPASRHHSPTPFARISSRPSPTGFLLTRAVECATAAASAAPAPSAPPPKAAAAPSGKITDEFTGAGAIGQVCQVIGAVVDVRFDEGAHMRLSRVLTLDRMPADVGFGQVVDLLAPYQRGGKIGLFGGAGVGKTDESKCAFVYGQMTEPPGARARVGLTGLTVAEHFRDAEGQDVLLFIDNIFRFTQRITTTKKGSITSVQAIYVPADELTDPAPATTFAHLDATTVLSRQISELGIYPAVDPLDSTSRMLSLHVLGEEHYNSARGVQKVLQNYKNLQDIIAILGMDELSEDDKLTVA